MKRKTSAQSEQIQSSTKREPYEAPAIIYEGLITTRSGSPIGSPNNNSDGVDPANIFSGNN